MCGGVKVSPSSLNPQIAKKVSAGYDRKVRTHSASQLPADNRKPLRYLQSPVSIRIGQK